MRTTINIIASLALACAFAAEGSARPRAAGGVLDLSGHDFEQGGTVELTGEARFAWGRLAPGDAAPADIEKQSSPFIIPQVWNWGDGFSNTYPAEGCGTYSMKVLLPEGITRLAVMVPTVYAAYELFCDGKRVIGSGVPSETAEGETPHIRPDYAEFTAAGRELFLVMRISNFHAEYGGFWEPMKIGSPRAIKREWFLDTVRAFTLIGAFFIMSFYFIAFYLLRKTDRAPLLFALFCIVMALRTLAMDQRFVVHLFDGFSWRVTRSLEYGGIYLGVPVFAAFLKALYGRFISDRFVKGISATGALFMLLEIVRIKAVYPHLLTVFNVVLLGTIGYFIYALFRAWRDREDGVMIIFTGLIFVVAAVLNDVLLTYEVVNTAYMTPFGILCFIFSLSFLISRRFSNSHAMAERLSAQLNAEKQALVELFHKIENAVRELNEFSATIKTTADSFQARMTLQGTTLEESSAAVEEMSSSIESIADKTEEQHVFVNRTGPVITEYLAGLKKITSASKHAEELSAGSVKRAEDGSRRLNEIVSGMEAIRGSSNEIGLITEVINDIAEKTNLLSLNASIEAARAGAYGRGFAVVADEIGKLADLSIQQAKSIQNHIQSAVTKIENEMQIVYDSEETLRGIGQSAGEVLSAVKTIGGLCEDQERMAGGLASNSREIEERSADIARSTAEQKIIVSEVSKAVEHLNSIMNDVLERTAVLNDSLVVLNTQTGALSTMISGGTGAGRA